MNGYLIPANSKKSLLIFGVFAQNDFIIISIGIAVTLLLLLVLPIEEMAFAIAAILPALVCSFLVFPIPNYHNMLTIIKNIYKFYTTEQKLKWKGWCLLDGESKK